MMHLDASDATLTSRPLKLDAILTECFQVLEASHWLYVTYPNLDDEDDPAKRWFE